ncbi:MAG: hypothetical protein AVDCRST_MAG88-600, partial [uncultured Thermomicrobiales bacterium]
AVGNPFRCPWESPRARGGADRPSGAGWGG